MNLIKFEGLIYSIGQLEKKTEKFSLQKVVIETIEENSNYSQLLEVQFTNDRTEALMYVSQGDKVLVTVSLRGREWKSPTGDVKYFNTLNGESIVRRNAPAQPTITEDAPEDNNNDSAGDFMTNSMPF
jgi:translation initiation factor IF-3